jgi:hypothetical protein
MSKRSKGGYWHRQTIMPSVCRWISTTMMSPEKFWRFPLLRYNAMNAVTLCPPGQGPACPGASYFFFALRRAANCHARRGGIHC